jgi:hypothetical protein
MARPLLLLCCLLAWSAPAAAQGIRRCVDAQGNSIFTDRPCSEMNAVPMEAPPAAAGNLGGDVRGGFSQRGCARRPEELLERVRAALEAHDVNRLASQYHWTGTGSGSGHRLMDELEAIAARALVSVELIYADPPSGPAPEAPFTLAPGEPMPEFPPPTDPPPANTPPRHLRVLQMRSDQAEQATSTIFQLRRNAGCWWIQL